MKRNVRSSIAGAAALCLAATLSAGLAHADYVGADPAVLEAARKEGTLTIYCTQDEDIQNQTARAFEAAVPGITVRILRLASTQLHSRLMAEVDSGVHELDLFCSPDQNIFAEKADWWLPITPEVIPNMAALPERAKQKNFLVMAQGVAMGVYNTQLLSADEAPKTWTDFLKPEFKGKGLLVDPRNSITYMTLMDYLHSVYGDEFLTKLRDQEFQLVSAGSPAAQEVAAGGALLAFPVTRSHIIPVVEKGAPVLPLSPWGGDVKTVASEQGFGLYAKASHPNAARAYLNWLLTPEAQKINCGGAYASLILPDNDRGDCPHFEPDVVTIKEIPEARRAQLIGLLGLN